MASVLKGFWVRVPNKVLWKTATMPDLPVVATTSAHHG